MELVQFIVAQALLYAIDYSDGDERGRKIISVNEDIRPRTTPIELGHKWNHRDRMLEEFLRQETLIAQAKTSIAI
jgi:hypothetical protein